MADFAAEQSFDGIDAGRLTTYLGGVVSLALIAGACVWGVKLVMRDVTGIPVVQAVDGPMRVASDNPGGVVVDNAGLSVNSVAGQGAVSAPESSVTLAPADAVMDAQDLTAAPQTPAPASEPLAQITEASAAAPLAGGDEVDVQNLIDEILAGAEVAPLAQPEAADASAQAPAPDAATDPNIVTVMVNGTAVQTRRAGSPLAVAVSLRPVARKPGGAAVASRSVSNPSTAPIASPATVPAGTPLAQLGAYDAETVAATEWARFSDTFPELMASLQPVVQRAQSGGKTFYRLRARGFADISAARRFCSALDARNTDCIPVISR